MSSSLTSAPSPSKRWLLTESRLSLALCHAPPSFHRHRLRSSPFKSSPSLLSLPTHLLSPRRTKIGGIIIISTFKFITDNEPFKAEMKLFTAKIVDMMKQENLYASQGGPIILSRIENEYGNVETHYGPAAKSYVNWAASISTSLDTGVPWVMCQQTDAPDPIINTSNGFFCDQFTPNSNQNQKCGLRIGVDVVCGMWYAHTWLVVWTEEIAHHYKRWSKVASVTKPKSK